MKLFYKWSSFFLFVLLSAPSAHALRRGPYDIAVSPYTLKINGAEDNDMTCRVVIGDVNGDRIKDIIVGSDYANRPSGDPSPYGAGRVYIIYGKVEYPSTINLAADANVVIYGETGHATTKANGDRLGYALAVGDLNGDRIDDLAIGTFHKNEVYVIWGGRNLPASWDLATAAADVTINYVSNGFAEEFISLAVGDVDGTGIGDLVMGIPFADPPNAASDNRDNAGVVNILLGRSSASAWPATINLATVTDVDLWTVYGSSGMAGAGDVLPDNCGYDMAVGNVNSPTDAYNDIIIGAPGGDGPQDDRYGAGEVYVVGGNAVNVWGSTHPVTGHTPTSPVLSTTGMNWKSNRFVGAQLKIISGPGSAAPNAYRIIANNANSVTVDDATWQGGPEPTTASVYQIRTVDTAFGEQLLTIYGKEGSPLSLTPDELGSAVASGDVNRDSVDDILCMTQKSKVVVYYGRAILGEAEINANIVTANTIGKSDGLGNNWDINRYIGAYVRITENTGAGQVRRIISNNATTVTVFPNWTTTPVSGQSDFAIAAWDLSYGDPTEQDEPSIVINEPAVAYSGRKLLAKDINGDNFSDIVFGNAGDNGKAYVFFSDTRSSPKTYATDLYDSDEDDVSEGGSDHEDGYDIKIYNSAGSGPGGGGGGIPKNVNGGDLNGDGASNEVIVGSHLAGGGGTQRGEIYLFLNTKIPVAEVRVEMQDQRQNKKDFVNYYRINPDGTMGEQIGSKVVAP